MRREAERTQCAMDGRAMKSMRVELGRSRLRRNGRTIEAALILHNTELLRRRDGYLVQHGIW